MNHGIKRLLVTMSLAFCLFVTVFSTQVKAEDANTGNEVVTYERKVRAYTAERVSKYLAGENSHPELDGYLFAGWYTDEKCDDTCYLGVNEPSGTMYALFIPKQVLGVQAQIKAALTDGDVTDDDTVTSLRFVTSVDSLNYREVGFYVTYEIGGQEYTSKSSSKKVYEELYYVDSTEGTMSVTPKGLFCNLSKYFKAGTVLNVPESLYGTEFKVQPFWVTMEGDMVKGEEVVKSVDIGCVRDEVYVSSATDEEGNLIAQDKPYYGTYDYPYASLDYAIAHVEDEGIVCVKDSLTVASSLTSWSAHGKSITITGYANDEDAETLIFDGNELSVKDSVTFSALNLTFANYVYANGNNLTVSEDVTVESAKYIYGGGKENEVSDTCLKLYAGSYSIIYGGSHNGNVDGDTYVEIGSKVNPNAQPTQHDARNYLLYGGCRYGIVTGDTKVVVKDGAKIEHLYGGGNNSTTVVEGSTYVEFTGQAYSVYGGSFKGTNGSTHIKMTGGTAYQVFGGCEGNSMEGNTDVQVLGGTVKRRIYGGCYNADDNSWGTEYHVTGNIFVTIGTDAEVSLALDSESDNSLYALTRDSISYDSEKGVFIFNDYENSSSNISKIGPDSLVQLAGVSTKTHHYQVNATSGGTVSQAGDCIYIKPSDKNTTATVRLDSEMGSIVYYAEEAGYYPLPDLVDGTRQVYVTFSADEQTDFATNTAAARIGNVYYAELDSAVKAAEKMENATIVGLNGTEELAAITIETTGQGTVKTDKLFCQPSEVVTLTVNPKEGYYCSALSVTKDGGAVALNEIFALDTEEYTFTTVDAGEYIVNATFAKKVFITPTSSKYTAWNLLEQNTSLETLTNGGTRISGTISATTQSGAAGNNNVITFVDEYTDIDLKLNVKEDKNNSTGNTPETRITYDFGDNRVFRISVYEYNGTVVIRENTNGVINKRLYAFTTEQEDNYRSAEGVELRIVKIDTQIFLYIDGKECAIGAVNNGGNTTQYYTGTDIDLTDFYTNNPITANTPASVNIRRVGDEGSQIDMLYSVANEIALVGVDINETANGTVATDRTYYFAGDTATLTVAPNSGYYCNSLIVKKDGVPIELDKSLNMTDTTYSFEVKDGVYTVEATFVEKVFNVVTNNEYTSWNLINQNESTETLENGGRKITGTVVSTDIYGTDKMDLITFNDTFTEMDLTYVAKDDSSTTEGSVTPGTQVEMKINGYTYKVRAVKNGDNIVLRVTGGMSKNTNMYTFTQEQAEDFASTGVKVRVVKYGTSVTFYVDGAFAYTADLAELNSNVTADAEMSVYLGRFGDQGTAVEIPFSVSNKVTPVVVKVYDDASELVANDTVAADVQTLDLTSNETYSVKLIPQGFESTAYFKITYVDHVAKQTQSVYTPAVAAGESFEFTYQNGVFNAETEAEIATIRWENRIKATKDVLTVEVVSGTPEGETIVAATTLGNAPMAKPVATTVETTWTIGTNVGSYNHAVAEGFTPGQHYAHTDVITVEKAGTKLSFTDDVKTNSWASDGCYVVSSWKQNEDGEWVLDKEGTNIPGKYASSKTITCTEGYDTFVERYGTDTSDTDGSITYTYITSKDNENIMFCYYAGKGTTEFPTITSIYSGETGTAEEIALAADTDEWLEADKTRAYYDIFAGKTISVIGDSYMAGSSIADTSDVWVNMFATKYGMTINNHGVNGSTISNYAGDKYNPMVDRWETDFESDTPDIIIVEGGRNDYNYNTPMGEIGTTDKGTMKGATTYLISSLKEKYPDAIIIGITCWEVGGNKNAAGYYCSDYGRAFIEVCESLGIPYVNAMDSDAMNVYMTSSNFRGRFCIKAGDISHLNEKGMKLVLPIFEEKIYNICK